MRWPQFSIRMLLVVVAIVALDFGVIGWVGRLNKILPAAIGATLVVFEVAVLLGVKSIRPSRAFWFGFASFGFLTGASVVKAWATSHRFFIGSGANSWSGIHNGNWLTLRWDAYSQLFEHSALDLAHRLPFPPEWSWMVLQGLIYAVPQLAIASTGGLLIHSIDRSIQRRRERFEMARHGHTLTRAGTEGT